MTHFLPKYILSPFLVALTLGVSIQVSAQKNTGQNLDEDVVITKDRKIELPPANRIFEKIPAIQNKTEAKQMKYTFLERKPTNMEVVKIAPTTLSPDGGKKVEKENFNNYVSLGAGNYGRLFGELFLNTPQDSKLVFGIHAKHNSTSKGPVDGSNSATQHDHLSLNGKYQTEKVKLTADGTYDYQKYNFYGYTAPLPLDYDLTKIKQRLNSFSFGASIENMIPEPVVDYSLKTNLRTTSDLFKASETDWVSSLRVFFPILPEHKLIALIDADASVSQFTDNNLVDSRNLFKVRPAFKYNTDNFSATLGYRAVNETDDKKALNRTKGYPTVDLTYKFPGIIYVYAGLDGDVVRNTWYNFLQENPYLAGSLAYKNQAMIQNTEKTQDIFVGVKGDLSKGLSFNLKGSYANYKNLSFYNNWQKNEAIGSLANDSTKFKILYDSLKTTVINVSAQLNYQPSDMWRTYLKADYFHYQLASYDQAFHRPNFLLNWGNTLIFVDKLVITTDLFYFGSSYAEKFGSTSSSNVLIKNKGYVDLNTEFNYLFSHKIQAFVRLNNLLNTKYQKYLYYPQQGLNFLVGINYSF